MQINKKETALERMARLAACSSSREQSPEDVEYQPNVPCTPGMFNGVPLPKIVVTPSSSISVDLPTLKNKTMRPAVEALPPLAKPTIPKIAQEEQSDPTNSTTRGEAHIINTPAGVKLLDIGLAVTKVNDRWIVIDPSDFLRSSPCVISGMIAAYAFDELASISKRSVQPPPCEMSLSYFPERFSGVKFADVEDGLAVRK